MANSEPVYVWLITFVTGMDVTVEEVPSETVVTVPHVGTAIATTRPFAVAGIVCWTFKSAIPWLGKALQTLGSIPNSALVPLSMNPFVRIT